MSEYRRQQAAGNTWPAAEMQENRKPGMPAGMLSEYRRQQAAGNNWLAWWLKGEMQESREPGMPGRNVARIPQAAGSRIDWPDG